MFCDPELIFGGTEVIRSLFHILCSRTRFRRYRGRLVTFSSFAIPNSFSDVPRASGPFFTFYAPRIGFDGTEGVRSLFMFCAPALVLGGTEGVGSRFHVLRSRTHFRRYQSRRVPFSCFALPDLFLALPISFSCFGLRDSFSAVPRASGPVLMFCAPGLVFGGTEGVGSRFHVLRSRARFWRYRGRPIPFSFFPLPNMFSPVPRASGPVFMFCAPGIDFGGIEGVRSRFHVLRSQTCFWRYRGRRVPFSCFSLTYSFSTVLRASGPVLMFCAP
jgi:hypothetical protein